MFSTCLHILSVERKSIYNCKHLPLLQMICFSWGQKQLKNMVTWKIVTIATERGLKTFWDCTLTPRIVLFQKYLAVLEILIVWFKKVESLQNFLAPISTRLISVLIQITEETIPILKPAENWNSKQSGWVEWKNMFLQKSLIQRNTRLSKETFVCYNFHFRLAFWN